MPSLSLPDPHDLPPVEELSRYGAVRLFVERAADVASSFAVTKQNAPAMAQVCQRLDGIPLAVELAAARVRVLPVEGISDRLYNSLKLLTGGSRTALPRHKTLEATIDWSHELLPEEERTLFRRLTVFAGGFTLEAAEQICAGEGIEKNEVLDLLSRLLDKSLVVVQKQGDEARYRLLEVIRQYGEEKLRGFGEAEFIRRDHAGFFLALAEKAEPRINGPDHRLWLERLEAEHDNFRAALSWAAEARKMETELRLAGALWWFWLRNAHMSEGRCWLEGALKRVEPSAHTAARAKALCGAGWLAFSQVDHAAAQPQLEESAALYREAGDRRGLAHTLSFLSVLLTHRGESSSARRYADESVRLFREIEEDRWGLAIALNNRGIVAEAQAEYAQAIPFFEESADILRRLEDRWALSLPLRHLGTVALRQGDHIRAERLYKESLEQCRQLGEKWLISLCLEELAGVACLQGQHTRAARLWGADETIREAIGATVRALYRADYDHGLTAARETLGDAAFTAAWGTGRKMTLEEAVAYALEEVPELPPTTYPAGLTAREVEVLKLVAQGLTNAKVAERLVLSPRTVNAHLRTIYGKIRVSSRAAATRFAVEHGLI